MQKSKKDELIYSSKKWGMWLVTQKWFQNKASLFVWMDY